MANNRMWLLHKKSKLGVKLGKRMSDGYYNPPSKDLLDELFNYVSDNFPDAQDDFILLFETDDKKWSYTSKYIGNLRILNFQDEDDV